MEARRSNRTVVIPAEKAGEEMAWISVWQEVDGPKLRKLAKELGCSKAEALGILNFLWFWGMNNADENGQAMEADRWDIEDVVQGATKPLSKDKAAIDPAKIVDALFGTGWLDERDGCVFIHDWSQWQEQWYKLQKERKRTADRVRKWREAQEHAPDKPVTEESPPPAEPEGEPKGETKPKKKPPEKTKYAEYVNMTEAEYGRLIEKYGKPFADACIEELDIYKGAKKGRSYKDDYRAILSWVVDRVKEKRPGLLRVSKESAPAQAAGKNPYEEWGD